MTEDEWFAATDEQLREAVWGLDPRRQRLLAVAVCRVMGRWVDYPAAHAALEAVETFADTGKTKAALRRARQAVQELRNGLASGTYPGNVAWLALFAVQMAASEIATFGTLEQAIRSLGRVEGLSAENIRRCFYPPYRDITGKPANLGAFSLQWRTSTAVQLAQGMYESRDFAAMPILADALQDAGCEDEPILSHCRDPHGVHVRGCWVVDLVLGKG